MQRLLLSLSLLCCGSSCVVLAGAGLGYVVSQEVLPNSIHEAQVVDEVDGVWTSVKETADILHDVGSTLKFTAYPRKVETEVDGSKVTIEVEAHDIDRTVIRVTADGPLGADDATAETVMNEVLRRLRA